MARTTQPRPKASAQRLVVTAILIAVCTFSASAQPQTPAATPPPAPTITQQQLPETRGPAHNADARIYGTVTDPHGNVIPAASVTLEPQPSDAKPSQPQQTTLTDAHGFFTFPNLPAGNFRIAITALGFANWTSLPITLAPGQYYELPDTSLQLPTANANVEVTFTQYDLAQEQIKAEEQQRILGVLPNFYASYIWHAVPMTPGQKFRLALRTSVDPVTFAVDGATAGIEQAQNAFSGYGQGAEGYARRFGAAYGDDVISTMIGAAILPSLLHQDPRYFYKGTGTIPSRALYAMSRVIICRGDNGRDQPNYSNVLGNLAAAGISNLYYPSSNRNGAEVTLENAMIGTAEGAVSALLQEFLLKKISHGTPKEPTPPPQ
jgi:hypothetical protein